MNKVIEFLKLFNYSVIKVFNDYDIVNLNNKCIGTIMCNDEDVILTIVDENFKVFSNEISENSFRISIENSNNSAILKSSDNHKSLTIYNDSNFVDFSVTQNNIISMRYVADDIDKSFTINVNDDDYLYSNKRTNESVRILPSSDEVMIDNYFGDLLVDRFFKLVYTSDDCLVDYLEVLTDEETLFIQRYGLSLFDKIKELISSVPYGSELLYDELLKDVSKDYYLASYMFDGDVEPLNLKL